MANKVTAKIPIIALGNSAIYVEVKKSDELLGTLTIRKSFIEWKPKNKKYGNRNMKWKEFAKVMAEYNGD